MNNDSGNILVALPTPMGDAILATTALRKLRLALPHKRITFLANPTVKEILSGCPWADDFILWDKKKSGELISKLRTHNFGGAILFTNSFRSALLIRRAKIKRTIGYNRDGRGLLLNRALPVLKINGRPAVISMLKYYERLADTALEYFKGQKITDTGPMELFTSPNDRQETDRLLTRLEVDNTKPLVILVPGGAFGPSKLWPAERFCQLADKLIDQQNCQVLISCSPAEKSIADQIKSTMRHKAVSLADEKLSLGMLKEIIRRANLMIANDTGPCHIAASFTVPLITLFGPTDPRWTATGYAGETRLRVNVDCGPCQQKTCSTNHRCLKKITVDDVHALAIKKLQGDKTQTTPTEDYFEVYNENYSILPDNSGLVHDDYKDELLKTGLDSLSGIFNFTGGEFLTKPGLGTRRRIRAKLQNGKVIYIKRYGREPFAKLLRRYISRRTNAAAGLYDFAGSLELAQKGIEVARPIAFGQKHSRLFEQRSFAILEELPHAEALDRLLKSQSHEYKMLTDRKKLINNLATLARKMHLAGLFHRDFYLCHIFLCRDSKGQERLSLIDLQRVFQPKIFKRRWQIKDLAQLYYSARDLFTPKEMTRFLHEYFEVKKLTTPQKNFIRAITTKANRISRHDQRREIRFTREPK